MSKATIENAHWQTRTGSASTHGSRKGTNLLGWDNGTEEHMTPDQEREALVLRWKSLNALPKEQRKEHGQEMHELQKKISSLRPGSARGAVDLADYVMTVLKERLGKQEYMSLLAEARRRMAVDVNAMNSGN